MDNLQLKLLVSVVACVLLIGLGQWYTRWRQKRKNESAIAAADDPNQPFYHEYSPSTLETISKRVFPDQDQTALRELFEVFQFKFSKKGTFIWTPPEGCAATFVREMFPNGDFQQIMKALGKYQSGSNVSDTESIHMCILKLADGNPDRIAALVKKAKSDFREVLVPATEPNLDRVLSKPGQIDIDGPEVMAAHDQDLRQFVAWLQQYTDDGRMPVFTFPARHEMDSKNTATGSGRGEAS